jgi:hypothetical protein
MISDKYKIIFIQIPKTGGTTIDNVFSSCKIHIGHEYNNLAGDNIDHAKLSDLIKWNLITSEKAEKYFKFTFVRNPWDRVLSDYFYLSKINYIPKLSFKEYLIELDKIVNKQESIMFSTKDYRAHFRKQTEYLLDCDFDFVGKFENFQSDFNKICNIIGKSKERLAKKNRTLHRHYSYYYDDESRTLADRIFKEDIQYLGYKFKKLNSIERKIDFLKYYLFSISFINHWTIISTFFKLSSRLKNKSPLYAKFVKYIKSN